MGFLVGTTSLGCGNPLEMSGLRWDKWTVYHFEEHKRGGAA